MSCLFDVNEWKQASNIPTAPVASIKRKTVVILLFPPFFTTAARFADWIIERHVTAIRETRGYGEEEG
jgi:hypothetical protein